jgi:hypothetical protein
LVLFSFAGPIDLVGLVQEWLTAAASSRTSENLLEEDVRITSDVSASFHSFAPSLFSYLSLFSVLHLSSLKAEMMECILSLEPYTIFFALQPQYWGTSSFP